MNNIIAFAKRLRLAQILVVFFAGMVLFISTACSSPNSMNASRGTDDGMQRGDAQLSDKSDRGIRQGDSRYNLKDIQAEHMKETYNQESGKKVGGMNEYSDTDARLDTSATNAQADRLVNQARKNLERRAANPKEAVENVQDTASMEKVGDKLNNLTDKVGRSVQDTKEGAQRGAKNLQENLKSAPDYLSEQGQKTKNPDYLSGRPQREANKNM